MTDREKFLSVARSYIGKTGDDICNKKLHLGMIVDWCAYSVSAIMQDCGFIGKYQGGIYGFASDAAREDHDKYGQWFLKGAKEPQPGDYIMFKYASFTNPLDKYSASHVGIVEAVNGNIATTLEGNVDGYGSNWAGTSTYKRKTRYLSSSDVYSFYRPHWQGETKTTGSSASTASDVDVTYQVHTVGGVWLPNVKNLADYAGMDNRAIDGILADVGAGLTIMYRVHTVGGSWLPWVRGRSDFAGIYGRQIDAIQMQIVNAPGSTAYSAEYRVSTTGSKGYLPWVRDYNAVNDDGYAGIKGKPIDRLQVRIVRK